uniref:Death domain-containing protein n=1 Tax=Amphimedon queenslandica TaxID=400682 RepID=A0A1X7TKB9_AMPQE
MEDILRIKMYTCTLNVPPLSLTYSILWSIEDRPTIKAGKTALDFAERKGHSDTATLLRVHSVPVERSNEVQKSDLIRLFEDSAAHYMLIGTALDVKMDDLLPIPGAATTNLILVFQRWMDSNKEVTWRKVLQVCDDFPKKLGKVKADVEAFLSSDRAYENFIS